MRKQDSIFSKENSHIWGTVYGVPILAAILLILFGNDAAKGFGCLLIAGVSGSWILLSAIEGINP